MTAHHASDPNFDPTTMSAIAQAVLHHPRIVHQADKTADTLVLALKDELLVHPGFTSDVDDIAEYAGNLHGAVKSMKAGDEHNIQVWRLTHDALKQGGSLHWSRKRRKLHHDAALGDLATVTPHHVAVVSHYDSCPNGTPAPPNPTPPSPWLAPFSPPVKDPSPKVVVIDTGLIRDGELQIANHELRTRGHIGSAAGRWLDTRAGHEMWRNSGPDVLDADDDHHLDGVAGHGTFVTGLVAKQSPQAEITVVGHRHEVMQIGATSGPDARRLFTSEISVAASLANHLKADVISCGFAFPTFDGYPSLGVWAALGKVAGDTPAIVAPAGNENCSARYWPATHPRVIGVGACNEAQNAKAHFSNYGPSVDCWARGKAVVSTYVTYSSPPGTLAPTPAFADWATWNGTCFAAPKVTGAIARVMVTEGVGPVEAYKLLVTGNGGVLKTELTYRNVKRPLLHFG